MSAPTEILNLVDLFHRNRDDYRADKYNEAQVRFQFLDPFFYALGWDVHNRQGHAEAYKDVIHEDAIKVGGATEAPDYCFRIGGTRKFFVEAKKPAVNVREAISPAYQLRRYAWSSKLPLSILTDFEEFAVYDCRIKPALGDKSSTARIMFFDYSRYDERWDEIAEVFSRESVLKGSFDRYANLTKAKRGTAAVDAAFLEEIENWRSLLAKNLALRNEDLSQRELNFAVQRTIDRIIFLRIAEDRGIEDYGKLLAIANAPNNYRLLSEHFRRADERYNSGLFHFDQEKDRAEAPDELTLTLGIDDKVLRELIGGLYYPESPYEFSVMPAEILGQVYEQFLGKVIRLTAGHRAIVEDKPEVKKAGGVYYTPSYIVDYIVKQTVGKLLEGKTPKQAGKLRVLDPACGSGSFLIGAYQFLLDWHRDWYVNDGPEKHTRELYESGRTMTAASFTPPLYSGGAGGVPNVDITLRRDGPAQPETPLYSGGARGGSSSAVSPSPSLPLSPSSPPNTRDWRLSTAERKRILLANIYGVDIDPQAVETTKLSLLLKVLEGESQQTLEYQRRLFHERALPDLGYNIKCGNSLIGPDFYQGEQMTLLDEEEKYRINVFDWSGKHGFSAIMKVGGFDAVIGNPPYDVLEKDRGQSTWPHVMLSEYVRVCKDYESALGGKLNLFRFFVVRSIGLVRAGGKYGMILPLALLADISCARTRRFLLMSAESLLADCFPQKDNPNRRVFLGAKLSTTVITGQRKLGIAESAAAIRVRVYPWNSFADAVKETDVRLADTRLIDSAHTPIPLTDSKNWALCRNVHARPGVIRLGDVEDFQVTRGEINQTVYRRFIGPEPNGMARLLKGVEVGRYVVREKLKQGEREWLNERELLREFPNKQTTSEARIATQRITGVDERLRVVATVIEPPTYFADSTNSICVRNGSRYGLEYLLALLNSRLFQWRFKLTSTNNNVATNELEAMPFRRINWDDASDTKRYERAVALVNSMLSLHKQLAAKTPHQKTTLERQIESTDGQIDQLVYQLYGLTDAEIAIVEGAAGK